MGLVGEPWRLAVLSCASGARCAGTHSSRVLASCCERLQVLEEWAFEGLGQSIGVLISVGREDASCGALTRWDVEIGPPWELGRKGMMQPLPWMGGTECACAGAGHGESGSGGGSRTCLARSL